MKIDAFNAEGDKAHAPPCGEASSLAARSIVLVGLMEKRYPIYAEADITVDSIDGPPELTLTRVVAALKAHLGGETDGRGVDEAATG